MKSLGEVKEELTTIIKHVSYRQRLQRHVYLNQYQGPSTVWDGKGGMVSRENGGPLNVRAKV